MGYDYRKFEKICEIRGVKPSTVSKATGISTATLSSWKGGKYTPKLDKIKKIAEYFGVNPMYFDDEPVPLSQVRDFEAFFNDEPGGRYGELKEDNEAKHSHAYYLDPETAKVAQEVYDNPNLRILFDAARNAKPEDIKMAADLLQRFKETNPDG